MKQAPKQKTPTILLLGPQGSGKGTQAKLLAKKHHFVHIEMGEMLRALRHKKQPEPFEKKVAAVIDKGRLVPSPWVVRLLDKRLGSVPQKRGVVLDGSGRRLREALALKKVLARHGRVMTQVILLDISRNETIRRLAKRWVCTKKHHILTMGKDIRRSSDHCPECGSAVFQRDDDKPRAIAKRLALYQRETKPVAAYYQVKGLLSHIDGERTIANVFRDVEKAAHKQPE